MGCKDSGETDEIRATEFMFFGTDFIPNSVIRLPANPEVTGGTPEGGVALKYTRVRLEVKKWLSLVINGFENIF